MTERTTVEFTQNGRRITFSAGYIIGVSPYSMHADGLDGKKVSFPAAIVTQLGLVFVDQEPVEVLRRWKIGIEEKEKDTSIKLQAAPRSHFSETLGNNAEF